MRNVKHLYPGAKLKNSPAVVIVRVRPHRKRAAAAGSDLCPRREGVRTVICKIASSPSNRRRADASDQSRWRRAVDICVLETDLTGGQYGMAEEFTEKLIEKVRDYGFLYVTVIFAQPFPLLIDFVHHLPFLLQLSANRRRRRSSSSELDIMK